MTTVAELLDLSIKEHMKLARHGDPDAVRAIHGLLANALREDKATPYMRSVLADMHQSVADGTSADEAMMTNCPPNRHIETTRKAQMFLEIEAMRWLLTVEEGKRPTDKRLFKLAASKFHLSDHTVKSDYLKQRKLFSKKD